MNHVLAINNTEEFYNGVKQILYDIVPDFWDYRMQYDEEFPFIYFDDETHEFGQCDDSEPEEDDEDEYTKHYSISEFFKIVEDELELNKEMVTSDNGHHLVINKEHGEVEVNEVILTKKDIEDLHNMLN